MPFIHAVGGCDTTSILYGIGKGLPLRKVKNNPLFKQQADVFMRAASKEDIHRDGEEAMTVFTVATQLRA